LPVAAGLMASLLAAERSGIEIDKNVLTKGADYVLALGSDKGSFAYNWHSKGNVNSATLATNSAGSYVLGEAAQRKALKYTNGIKKILASIRDNPNELGGWSTFAIYYGSLATYGSDAKDYDAWRTATAEKLMKGTLTDFQDVYGGVFVALATISLELSNGHFTVFHAKRDAPAK
jgi:hypothetical protein